MLARLGLQVPGQLTILLRRNLEEPHTEKVPTLDVRGGRLRGRLPTPSTRMDAQVGKEHLKI